MNRWNTQIAASLIAAVVGGGIFVGCSSLSESERTQRKADGMGNAADLIRRGETNVVDGKALIARGEELKSQNKDVEGDRLLADGKNLVALGESQIEQGRRIKEKND